MRLVRHPLRLLAVVLFAGSAANAATLCVNSSGFDHCYPTISDAVTAAAPGDDILVGPGTYRETVVITKPLSLTGIGATINASGLSRGIFINGMASPGLAQIHIAGFTIRNANLEGILVANASAVTLSSNTVLNNNRALSNGTCPPMDAFEPGEQMDCGEGIHLLGADHSIVTGNTVRGNSGGILLSDDTGATHDNLISFNTVMDNPYACGIVLASHPQASGSPNPPGVFHNTVYGNHSQHNGYSVGGGAGIGLFAAVPNAATYSNVIVNNTINQNGHPGISLHGHIPGQNLSDNMLVGNTISDNGADTADAATPGPTGINIYAAGPVPGNILSANTIQRETDDVAVSTPTLVEVEFNNLLGRSHGIDNRGAGSVDATWNFWNCPLGPEFGGACSSPAGNNILTTPWLLLPATVQQSY